MNPGTRQELGIVLALALVLGGQQAPGRTDEAFTARSVTLRTALHHDASLDGAFRDLVDLYREAGREAELRGLYEGHLTRYPGDLGARAVWIRLLLAEEDPEGVAQAREAARAHPDNALFSWLVYQATGDIASLERAVALETVESVRVGRLRELGAAVTGPGERALAEAAWRRELGVRAGQSADAVRELAGWMRQGGFAELAWEAMGRAWELGPDGEAQVEMALLEAAWAESEEVPARRDAVRTRLGALRERLAADHPRREDVVLAGRALQGSHAALADEAVAAWRAEATAGNGVDAAVLLEAADRGPEAVEMWTEVAARHPGLEGVLERLRHLVSADVPRWKGVLDRLGAAGSLPEEWVRERVVLEYRTGGEEAGRKRRDEALRTLEPEGQGRFGVSLGEDLLAAELPAAAAECFGRAWEGNAGFAAAAGRIRALAAAGDGEALRKALAELGADAGSEAEGLALATWLEDHGWESEAADLTARLAGRPGAGVLARLRGLERVPGEEEMEVLEAIRKEGPSGEDYRRWLIAAAEAGARRGDAGEPWRRETARLAEELAAGGFTGGSVGRWTLFAEVARERGQGAWSRALVEAVLPPGADESALPADTAVRRLVAEVWETAPHRVLEAERLWLALERDDVARADEARARLALLADRTDRPDLAQTRLRGVSWEAVGVPEILVPAAELAERMGEGAVATRVWARWVALRPGDVTAWERYLGSLLRERDEERFRAAAGGLLSPGGPLELTASARQDLRDAVFASWQRELAGAGPERREGRVRALRREGLSEEARQWAVAFQAWDQRRRGEDVAESGWEDRETDLGGGWTVNWAALAKLWGPSPGEDPDSGAATDGVRRLLGPGWVHRGRPGRRITALRAGQDHLLVLDDRLEVRALAPLTGKILWSRDLARPGRGPETVPGEAEARAGSVSPGRWSEVTAPAALEAWGGRVFTADDHRVTALAERDGAVLWEAEFGVTRGGVPAGRIRCPIRLARAGADRLAVLVPEGDRLAMLEARTGKVAWEQASSSGGATGGALGVSLAANGMFVAVLGDRLCLHGAGDGRRLWSRGLAGPEPLDLDGIAETPSGEPGAEPGGRHVALDGKRVLAVDGERVFFLDADFPGPGASWKRSGAAWVGFRGDTVVWGGRQGLEVAEAATGNVRCALPGPGPGGWFGRHVVWNVGNQFVGMVPDSGRRVWRSPIDAGTSAWPEVGGEFVASGRIETEPGPGRGIRHLVPVRAEACAGGVAWVSASGAEVTWWRGERAEGNP